MRTRHLGRVAYLPTYEAMQAFTTTRQEGTADELWLCEHEPVFTQGLAGQASHVLAPGDIPVVPTNRGGQVTYHGPGQLVAYLLLDVRRAGIGVRELVERIEQSVIDVAAQHGIAAEGQRRAPGVYVNGAKLAALGLRIRNGCSYHGLSLNIDMDLAPFSRINPCGYAGMAVTQLRDVLPPGQAGATLLQDTATALTAALARRLGYPVVEDAEPYI